MTICLKTSSAGSASEGFSDMHAETARMSGITNRVLRPVPDAEARIPIRGRHNLRYAIEKPWVETRGFSIAGGWDWSDVEVQVVFYCPGKTKATFPCPQMYSGEAFFRKKATKISLRHEWVRTASGDAIVLTLHHICGILLQR